MSRGITRALTLAVALLAASRAHAQQGTALGLTRDQAAARAEMAGEPHPHAFAVSPDGAWGRSWGADSAATAAKRALGFCRRELRRGKTDCILFSQDGVRVAPETVTPRKVRDVYKPLNGRKAAAVIGRVPFDFAGAPDAARTQLAAGGALVGDPGLRRALEGRSIMTTATKGFGIWLGRDYAEHMGSANSGVLSTVFDSWTVTSEGLVCMYGGRWRSSGQPVGTKCFILGAMRQGQGAIYWDGSPNAARKAQVIAGDVSLGAVK
ncbi:hypothetical protein [Tateyamaria sp. SN6-1]|uniref:hypothetical protein n=1 Tax=Tateyamaria sp. SN6-1 TaxID=3092148 RepID=UPI0039F4AB61